jgi:hypothetical protein
MGNMHDQVNNRSNAGEEGARSDIDFVAELTGELSGIARRHRFDALAYLLDMAKLEAENIRREIHTKDH